VRPSSLISNLPNADRNSQSSLLVMIVPLLLVIYHRSRQPISIADKTCADRSCRFADPTMGTLPFRAVWQCISSCTPHATGGPHVSPRVPPATCRLFSSKTIASPSSLPPPSMRVCSGVEARMPSAQHRRRRWCWMHRDPLSCFRRLE